MASAIASPDWIRFTFKDPHVYGQCIVRVPRTCGLAPRQIWLKYVAKSYAIGGTAEQQTQLHENAYLVYKSPKYYRQGGMTPSQFSTHLLGLRSPTPDEAVLTFSRISANEIRHDQTQAQNEHDKKLLDTFASQVRTQYTNVLNIIQSTVFQSATMAGVCIRALKRQMNEVILNGDTGHLERSNPGRKELRLMKRIRVPVPESRDAVRKRQKAALTLASTRHFDFLVPTTTERSSALSLHDGDGVPEKSSGILNHLDHQLEQKLKSAVSKGLVTTNVTHPTAASHTVLDGFIASDGVNVGKTAKKTLDTITLLDPERNLFKKG